MAGCDGAPLGEGRTAASNPPEPGSHGARLRAITLLL